MTIVFVRHGQTLLNVARILQPADTPLGPHGVVQANAVARRLAACRPAAVLSSDLPRALQTAQAIATAAGIAASAVETSTLLRERNFGDWRGLSYDALGFNPLTMAEAPPGGESAADFHARAACAFQAAVARRAALSGPLIVVSHGLLLHCLLSSLLRDVGDGDLPHGLANTSVTVVSATPPHRVSLLDCTRHLEAATGTDTATPSAA